MTRFEHGALAVNRTTGTVQWMHYDGFRDDTDAQHLPPDADTEIAAIGHLGSAGWELVALTETGAAVDFYFKRQRD